MPEDIRDYTVKSIGASGLQRRLLGLRGYSWIIVIAVPIFTMMASDSAPLALAAGLGVFWFIKAAIDSKPPHWLLHAVIHRISLPKYFAHRSKRSPVFVFKDSES